MKRYISALLFVLFLLPGLSFAEKPELPADIQWLTNDTDPEFASPDAQKGGTFNVAIATFPLTFRTVGPDSNTNFRSAILGNQLSLIGLHSNTLNIIPELSYNFV